MTLESDLEILRKVGFFQDFQPEPLRLLAFSAETRDYADRAILFNEGDAADGGYVVMSGRIDLNRTENGQNRILMSLSPSTLIGELALIIETIRTSRAVSMGRSRVLHIPRATFWRVLTEYPEIAATLFDKIGGRLGSLAPELDRIRASLEDER
jgi:CRP-like cAMP-binding protein